MVLKSLHELPLSPSLSRVLPTTSSPVQAVWNVRPGGRRALRASRVVLCTGSPCVRSTAALPKGGNRAPWAKARKGLGYVFLQGGRAKEVDGWRLISAARKVPEEIERI